MNEQQNSTAKQAKRTGAPDKFKIISLVLALALLTALVRLFSSGGAQTDTAENAVYQNILTRASVRDYTDQKVSRETLDTLVRAAMAAPTAKDLRPWKFVVIDDKQTLEILGNNLPHAEMAAKAAAAICVCGDTAVVDKEGHPSNFWLQDCSAASENILLCATSLGLGAVWTGVSPVQERIDKAAEILNLPDNLIPLNVIYIGYPKAAPHPKDKYNAENVRYNAW